MLMAMLMPTDMLMMSMSVFMTFTYAKQKRVDGKQKCSGEPHGNRCCFSAASFCDQGKVGLDQNTNSVLLSQGMTNERVGLVHEGRYQVYSKVLSLPETSGLSGGCS